MRASLQDGNTKPADREIHVVEMTPDGNKIMGLYLRSQYGKKFRFLILIPQQRVGQGNVDWPKTPLTRRYIYKMDRNIIVIQNTRSSTYPTSAADPGWLWDGI